MVSDQQYAVESVLEDMKVTKLRMLRFAMSDNRTRFVVVGASGKQLM